MDPNPRPNVALHGATRLDDWGVIRARGADAVSFLHGQLTSDVAKLGATEARLAGYCSAKGRLLASFVVWKAGDDELLLACSAGLLAATLRRLRMFVLRARCELSDASAEWPLYGLAGPDVAGWLGDAAPATVWHKSGHAGFVVIRLPDAAAGERYLAAGAGTPPLPPLAPAGWRWLEVASGVARIEPATVEKFVPQMLNLELLGGVDFAKGCYPGQEVVARSQYRGGVKRRSFLFEVDAPAAAGQEVFLDSDPLQPAGMVVNAADQAAVGATGSLVLVEARLAALGGSSLRLAAADGPLLRRVALPYAVPGGAAEAA